MGPLARPVYSLIGTPNELQHFPGNPIPRPQGVTEVGVQFVFGRTSYEQALTWLSQGFYADLRC